MNKKEYRQLTAELIARQQVLEDEVERLERMVLGLNTILSLSQHRSSLEVLDILANELCYEDRAATCERLLKDIEAAEQSIPKDICDFFGKVYEKPTGSNFKFGGF